MNIAEFVRHNPIARPIWHAVRRVFEFHFICLFDETELSGTDRIPQPALDGCTVDTPSAEDLRDIAAHGEVPKTDEKMHEWLADERICLVVRHRGRIVAYSWCNLRECSYRSLALPLRPDEAYLYGARTFREYRGKNIAPFLRGHLHRHLRQLGRTRMLSMSDTLNSAAMRFKSKIGARRLRLYCVFSVFGKHLPPLLLRNYEKDGTE